LADTPSGYGELCSVEIFGQSFTFMNTAEVHNQFNGSMSFVITCENQEEIDTYWHYFINEGEESQCGWCIDKFGIRFQTIPSMGQQKLG